jgi:hypothetical protein
VQHVTALDRRRAEAAGVHVVAYLEHDARDVTDPVGDLARVAS